MAKEDLCLIYMTVSSLDEGTKIATALLDKHLIGCANLLPKMTSLYRWKGKVETSEEVVLIVKTSRSRFFDVEKLVKALHSYEVPCLLQLDVGQFSAAYGQWLLDEIK